MKNLLKYFLITIFLLSLSSNFTFAECIGTFPYDWEIKRIPLNSSLSLSIPLFDIPSGTIITASIFKKQENTARSEKFGASGVQVFKDLQPANLNALKTAYKQFGSEITGESMVEKHLAMLAGQGIRWINLTYSWNSLETRKGNFKTTSSDIIFRLAKKYGLNIIPNVHNAPPWAAGLTSCVDNPCKCIPNDITSQNGSQNYNNFLTLLVNRYKPHGNYYLDNPNENDNGYGISNWVVWNEPDNINPYFFAECDNMGYTRNTATIQKYADLFKGAYTTIKTAHPSSKVVLAAFLNDAKIMEFYTGIAGNGGQKPDIINFHNYASSVDLMRNAINGFLYKKNNLLGENNKDIWITEFSKVYDQSAGGTVQSAYLRDVFNLFDTLSGSRVAKALWWPSKGYTTGSGSASQGTDTSMALMEPNFFPRLSYYQLGTTLGTTTTLPKVQTTSTSTGVNINIPASTFSTQGEYIISLTSWNKIVINKPIAVYVGTNPPICTSATPTLTPTTVPHTPTIPPTVIPTVTPSPTCTKKTNNFTPTDFINWKLEFINSSGNNSVNFDCTGPINLNDFEFYRYYTFNPQ